MGLVRAGVLVCLVVVLGILGEVNALSPYKVLGISETASMDEIDRQYKKLRSRNRRSRSKKHMMKQAYNRILFERQFNAKEEVEVPPV